MIKHGVEHSQRNLKWEVGCSKSEYSESRVAQVLRRSEAGSRLRSSSSMVPCSVAAEILLCKHHLRHTVGKGLKNRFGLFGAG